MFRGFVKRAPRVRNFWCSNVNSFQCSFFNSFFLTQIFQMSKRLFFIQIVTNIFARQLLFLTRNSQSALFANLESNVCIANNNSEIHFAVGQWSLRALLWVKGRQKIPTRQRSRAIICCLIFRAHNFFNSDTEAIISSHETANWLAQNSCIYRSWNVNVKTVSNLFQLPIYCHRLQDGKQRSFKLIFVVIHYQLVCQGFFKPAEKLRIELIRFL